MRDLFHQVREAQQGCEMDTLSLCMYNVKSLAGNFSHEGALATLKGARCRYFRSNARVIACRGEIKSVEFIGAAGLSKLIAAVATYPHEVVRTRMREREAIYKSAIDCVR